MKTFFSFSMKAALGLFFCAALFLSCGNRNEQPSADALDSDTSYAFGMFIASQMGLHDFSFDYDAFRDGFRDFNEGRELRITQNMAMEKISEAFNRFYAQEEERMWLEGERNREEGEAYMAENAIRSGVTTTASGLQYEVIVQGTGERPGPTDVVRVHYEGTLIDGTVFDSSFRRGEPIEFPLDRVISGWTEGLQLMQEGSTFRFVIPPHLAYGPSGAGPIPPNATLIFLVEFISIVR